MRNWKGHERKWLRPNRGDWIRELRKFDENSRQDTRFDKFRALPIHKPFRYLTCRVPRDNAYVHNAGRSEDRIPMGTRFSAPIQTGPGTHPASCVMGTGSLPGDKAAGAWR